MSINKIALNILLFFFSLAVAAKDIGMEVSYIEFMSADNEPYLELYFALDGGSLDYVEEEQGFIGGVEVTVTLLRDSNIVAADKLRMLSPHLSDTSDVSEVFINQLRLPVEKGTYTLRINIQDINEPEESYEQVLVVETVLGEDELSSSELLLLDSYQKSEGNSIFSKSGYDLIPLVTSGQAYFNESVSRLSFYTEVYNTVAAMGEGNPYVVKYYIRDADVNRVLNDFASFSKKTASEVEPVLAGFSIANLPSGNYELVMDVLDREGEVVLTNNKFFYRKNNVDPVVSAEVSDKARLTSFVQKLSNPDSIYVFIKYLYPISTDAERRYQASLLEKRDQDLMNQYFYAFWSQRNEVNPAGQWEKYYRNVRITNRLYGSRIRPGYMSDRGRVFLTYGKPDMIDRRKMEPYMPPYEIWQYNNINTPYVMQQTNRMFVFAEFNPSTNEYELFHSTAVGELQSRRWRYDMQLKYSGAGGNVDDTRDMRHPTDPFGTRTEDNIIINSTGSDRQNR